MRLYTSELVKKYKARTVVDHVSIDVNQGEIVGLLGPNGAGKTTTFSMMCGYILPTTGSVKILDRGPADIAALRGKVGVLPQDAILPQRETVGEFLISMAVL